MGFAPRFLVEAGFLILLGVGSGLADLRAVVVVAVLAGGWLLVSLVELAAWRAHARPAVPFVPPRQPPPPEPEREPSLEEPPPPEVAYPLRADAGSEPSEEIEAYTRVIDGDREDEPARQPPDRE